MQGRMMHLPLIVAAAKLRQHVTREPLSDYRWPELATAVAS